MNCNATIRAVLKALSTAQGAGQPMQIEPLICELSKLLEATPDPAPERQTVIIFANQVTAHQLNIECPGVKFGQQEPEEVGQ